MGINQGDMGHSVGGALQWAFDTPNPMGHWTGLPPMLGAPASGALWGAGLGALYGGYKALSPDEELSDPSDPNSPMVPKQRASVARQALIGALLGGGAGVASGVMQTANPGGVYHKQGGVYHKESNEKSASDAQSVVSAIDQDYQVSDIDKQRLLSALSGASPSQWSMLMMMAAGGTLTGMAASRVLGLGLIGTMFAAGAGALIAKNLFGQPITYV